MSRARDAAETSWLSAIQNMPGPLGFAFRFRYWKRRLKQLGSGSRIDCGVYFQAPQFISIGENCWIDRNVIILAGRDQSKRRRKTIEAKSSAEPGHVFIGRNVHVAPFTILSGIDSGIHVGDDCSFAAGVRLFAFSHHFRFHDDPGDRSCRFSTQVAHEQQSLICGPITLEENVGVALNAVILPGVWIGRDSFVTIGSVVRAGAYEVNSLLAGSPAVRVGSRFSVT